MHRNLCIIGLMASGKTTVGRLLAQSLGWAFFDSDQVIEERAGAPVAWIFDLEGEDKFRDREQRVIEELTQKERIVLATGGGAVLRPGNRRKLAARGWVVHLDCPLERLLERTAQDRRRPLLQGVDARQTLEKLHRERAPLYEEIAHYRFVPEEQSGPRVLARRIECALREDGRVP